MTEGREDNGKNSITYMIYALYGSDTYRSRKKMNQIIAAFCEKAGAGFNLHRFYAGDQAPGELRAMMDMQSLFTPKKLVVVEGAFADHMAEIMPLASHWKDAKDQHLVLFHEMPDAHAKKQIKAWEPMLTQSQEFGELTGAPKEQWIRRESAERDVSLSPAQLHRLADGAMDSWSVAQEIEKIAVGGSRETIKITRAMPTVFDLGDAFFTEKKRAMGMLHRLLESGEDEFGLFSYLVNRSRALVAIKQCAEERRAVPSWLKIHPFVVKKTESLARSLTPAQCAAFMKRFFEEDFRIKVGLSNPRDSLMGMLME